MSFPTLTPPTDNLYKFMAIAGIVVGCFGIVFPQILRERFEIDRQIIIQEAQSAKLIGKKSLWRLPRFHCAMNRLVGNAHRGDDDGERSYREHHGQRELELAERRLRRAARSRRRDVHRCRQVVEETAFERAWIEHGVLTAGY